LQLQLQKVLAVVFLLLVPKFLFASDSAMVITAGHAMVNGSVIPSSSALFDGDVIATAVASAATIDANGSMVLVMPNSSVQFKGNYLDMGNGDVVVTTSKGMAVKVGKFTISPAATQSAKFEVSHVGGMVIISARQGSLNFSDGKNTETIAEGQQMTRADSDQVASKKDKAPAGATSAVHMSKTAFWIAGGVAAAGATAGILLATRGNSHAVSTSSP
jgi:hypothetical protein